MKRACPLPPTLGLSATRVALLAGLALACGCSLAVDFDRETPAFDAGTRADQDLPGPDAASLDGRTSDAAFTDALAEAEAGPADAAQPRDLGLDAAVTGPDEGPGPDDADVPDAVVQDALAEPVPEACPLDGERRMFPCDASPENRFRHPNGTAGARRVEVCRDGLWTLTVACAHAPPVACAMACGDCPTTPGDTMPIELGTLQAPDGSTFDLYFRFPVSVAPMPTDFPVDLIGWQRSDAWFLADNRRVRQLRSFDAGGHQTAAERLECVPINDTLTCQRPSRFVDTPVEAGGRYVLREHFEGHSPDEVARRRDVIRLTPDGTRIDRLITGGLPAGPLDGQDLANLDASMLGPGLTYIYHYDDPTALPLPSSVTTENPMGTHTETRAYLFDDGGRPLALTFYEPAPPGEVDRVTQQRQIDTTCFDCGPGGCKVSEMASVCTWVGFMDRPTGICEPPGIADFTFEQAAEHCRIGRTPEVAEREGYGLARLPDGVPLGKVETRLQRLGRYADGRALAVWVGAQQVQGVWRWNDGVQVDVELLTSGCDAGTWPEGTGLILHPDRTGLCGPPDPTRARFGALCHGPPVAQN